MEEKVINDLLIIFTETTPINKDDSPPSKIISNKDSTPSCRPSKEHHVGRGRNLSNTFLGKQAQLSNL
jgi:hypothetical protein